MPTRIKNCGLKSIEAIDQSIATGAGFVGFVYHPPSPRHLDIQTIATLVAHARPLAKTVAVMVDPADDLLNSITSIAKPDFLQLHAIENLNRIQHISNHYQLPVISAISVHSEADLFNLATMEEISTHLLFDAKEPGSGKPFDWRLLKNLPLKKRWFLAGGLNAENVAQAMQLTSAPMVDVSSGIEDPPGSGIKSLEKIAAFNKAVLQAAHA